MNHQKNLSFPSMLQEIRCYISEKVQDPRQEGAGRPKTHCATDALMSSIAMFSLKFPSLLQFDRATRDDDTTKHNLKTVFGVKQPLSDTTTREILDVVDPREYRLVF